MKPRDFPEAVLSPDGVYRYVLRRSMDLPNIRLRGCCFVMLNPSTADASTDDATIRRCRGFAWAIGCEDFLVVNLFAFRSTDPKRLLTADDPIGPDCDEWIRRAAEAAIESGGVVIAAWGAHARGLRRVRDVLAGPLTGIPLQALAVTADGIPRHPCRLPTACRPQPWTMPA